MQPPPVYNPVNVHVPPKGNSAPWIILAVCGVGGCFCCVVVSAILFPVFAQARAAAKQRLCLSNVKQLGLASLIYCEDYDDRLPKAASWMDELSGQPRAALKRSKSFHCPSVRGGFGYGMNSSLSVAAVAAVPDMRTAALLFESSDTTWNAHSHPAALATPPRHPRGNMVAFLDGHAKVTPPGTALQP